jgi:hypothetical protein
MTEKLGAVAIAMGAANPATVSFDHSAKKCGISCPSFALASRPMRISGNLPLSDVLDQRAFIL